MRWLVSRLDRRSSLAGRRSDVDNRSALSLLALVPLLELSLLALNSLLLLKFLLLSLSLLLLFAPLLLFDLLSKHLRLQSPAFLFLLDVIRVVTKEVASTQAMR
jgi:hypothetical protein